MTTSMHAVGLAFREISLAALRFKALSFIEQVGHQHLAWLSPDDVLILLDIIQDHAIAERTQTMPAREKIDCERFADEYVPCPRCAGCGEVRVPDWLAPHDIDDAKIPDGVTGRYATFLVLGMVSINEACKEAKRYAVVYNVTAVFEFNRDQAGNPLMVAVRPTDDVDTVIRDWYQKSLGKSPEQLLAERVAG